MTEENMIKLRGHHFLCMLVYSGKGYSKDFVEMFNNIVTRIESGEYIVPVVGPDDVCVAVKDLPGAHCHAARITYRDSVALDDVSNILAREFMVDQPILIQHDDIFRLRKAFAAGQIRSACAGCAWNAECSTVADTSFVGARMKAGVNK